MKELDGDPFWILRKAVFVVAISGGLRCAEVTDLKFDDFNESDGTYHFTIKRKKQQGEQLSSKFIIPTPLSIHLNNYIVALTSQIGEYVLEGRLFKGTPKYNHQDAAKFVNQAMGKNKLAMVGVDIARMLQLPHPEAYTGHCFRRTSATIAADGGVTTTEMMRHFGWKSAKTAQRYVDNSDIGASNMAGVIAESGPSRYFMGKDTVDKEVQPSTSVVKTVSVSSVGEKREIINKTYHIKCAGDHSAYNFY